MTKMNFLRTMLLTSLLLLPALSNALAQETVAQEAVAQETVAQETVAQEAVAQEAVAQETVAQEEEGGSALMTISRFVTCQAVEDREPVGSTTAFPSGTETAYAYLEATEIGADVEVSFVWYHESNEVARVPLSIRQGSRWRTYSSKKLAGRTGAWRVEIQDSASAVLASVDFTVE
ncbi:MAG: DUF2914 domain-containing protein [Thermodesulfobacteriota bacterium]